jgi:tRNA dimethylallyltransferase
MDKLHNTVIIIVGPTASGKTALSLKVAEHFQTSIISADSRQCYKELNIGVAKPTDEELNSIKHYFINSHSIFDNVNAQTFEGYALEATKEIFKHNSIAVMVGGTGLYIKSFCEGFDIIPPVEESVRKKIIEDYHIYGLAWLQNQVQENDPDFWKSGEQQNPQRLIRALEVVTGTGKSITTFRQKKKKERPFNIIKIGIKINKEILHKNINGRVDKMIEMGLIKEVENLLPHKNISALQTVGYRELFEYLENKVTLLHAIDTIKNNTRQYAKRQATWFKKDSAIVWNEIAVWQNKISNFNFFTQL